jgi:hypothetical protein
MKRFLEIINVFEGVVRTIPIFAAAFAALLLSTLGAHADGTWCVQYGSPGGGN